MDALHEIEIAVILVIQSIGSWLATPMDLISMLGREEFYLLAAPFIYWSLDGLLGLRVAFIMLLSHVFNLSLKFVLHNPRPYWLDANVTAYSTETSFGIPSNHAQISTSVWGLILVTLRKTWVKAAIVAMLFLIGFSRIFLGMHFISDVVFGWIFGAILVVAFLYIEAPVARWIKTLNLSAMVALALISSLILAGVMLLASIAKGDWQIPAAWIQTALAATPDTPIDPFNLDTTFTVSGTWFGMMAGAAWLFHRQGGFNADGTVLQRFLRFLVGLVGIVVFWYLLGKVFPRQQDVLSFALRFLRYTIIGLWVTAAAPMLFNVMGLTKNRTAATPAAVPEA